MVLWLLQPVGFVTFATKDDAEAAKLELQVFIAFFLLTFYRLPFVCLTAVCLLII